MDPKAMQKLSYGLFVLTAKTGEKLNGCITNTAIQVTTEPNQIAFAVNKANLTHDMVKESGRFVISIISEKAEFSLFKHFGFQSGRNVDKFADFDSYKLTESGIPYITAGINAYRGRVRHLCLLSRQHQAQAPGSQKDRRRQGHLALHDLRL